MKDGYFPVATQAPDVLLDADEASRYRTGCASLIWVLRTRPELKFSVGRLCKFMHKPGSRHFKDFKDVVRYLANNPRRGLMFSGDGPLVVDAFSDADWGADPDGHRSVGGYVCRVGGNLVIAKSKQQTIVAQSSCESELCATADAYKSVAYFRNLLGTMGYVQDAPSTMFVDNQSAISVCKSKMSMWRNRHVPIRYFMCRGAIDDGELIMKWVSTDLNMADLFTKSLGFELFVKHRGKMTAEVP